MGLLDCFFKKKMIEVPIIFDEYRKLYFTIYRNFYFLYNKNQHTFKILTINQTTKSLEKVIKMSLYDFKVIISKKTLDDLIENRPIRRGKTC